MARRNGISLKSMFHRFQSMLKWDEDWLKFELSPICANNLTHSLFRWVGTKGKPRRIDAGYYFSICAFLLSLSPAHLRRASSRTRYTVVRRQIVTFRIVQTVFFLRAQSIVSSRFPAEIHTKQLKFSSFICFFFYDSSSRCVCFSLCSSLHGTMSIVLLSQHEFQRSLFLFSAIQ